MTAEENCFPELGNRTNALRLTELALLRYALEKDQLFRAHDVESRMEHPAFAKHLQGLVAGMRNLPIAPTIRFEIPIVEIAA